MERFNPDTNNLFRNVEKAQEILRTGTTTIGIKCKDGIVLASDKQATAGLLVASNTAQKIFKLGEQFIETCKQEHPPGIIGPFALQGAIASEQGKEVPIIFDVSMRIPGSPGTSSTPHTSYLYGDSISYGERIAMEIQQAIKENKLDSICT